MTTLEHTEHARLSLGKRAPLRGSSASHGWPAEWARTTPEPHPPPNPAATQSVGLKNASALSKAQIHHNTWPWAAVLLAAFHGGC
jgi:hypothetical protein